MSLQIDEFKKWDLLREQREAAIDHYCKLLKLQARVRVILTFIAFQGVSSKLKIQFDKTVYKKRLAFKMKFLSFALHNRLNKLLRQKGKTMTERSTKAIQQSLSFYFGNVQHVKHAQSKLAALNLGFAKKYRGCISNQAKLVVLQFLQKQFEILSLRILLKQFRKELREKDK